jgi:ERF superfamily protein
MPDTVLQSSPAAFGIVSDYRSPLIGQLVAARAKATKEIKTIVKDKRAEIPNKNGGRGYAYSYADLADVMDAVDDALAAQEMALFQTIQDRGGKSVLVTTLAHSSDQWISSEVRIISPDAGPQVFGSSMTYLRRYCALGILGLAPDADDDGKAAQERADQQTRQKPAQRAEPSRSIQAPPKTPQATPAPSSESDEPEYMPIPTGRDGPLYGRWTKAALEMLKGKPEAWRRDWLTIHEGEIEELRNDRVEYANSVQAAAIAPDMPAQAEAAE